MTRRIDTSEFEFNQYSREYTLLEFCTAFGDHLPKLVVVTIGLSRKAIFLNGIAKQRRVLAKVRTADGERLLSFPDTFEEPLCVVTKKGYESQQSLFSILQHHELPATVCLRKDKTVKLGERIVNTAQVSSLQLIDVFNEIHLLGNFLAEGRSEQGHQRYICGFSSDVVGIPLFSTQLRVSIVHGIKHHHRSTWKSFFDILRGKSSQYEYDLSYGKSVLTEYHWEALRSSQRFCTIRPKALIEFNLLVQQITKNTITEEKVPDMYDELLKISPIRNMAKAVTDGKNVENQYDVLETKTAKPSVKISGKENKENHQSSVNDEYETIDDTAINDSETSSNNKFVDAEQIPIRYDEAVTLTSATLNSSEKNKVHAESNSSADLQCYWSARCITSVSTQTEQVHINTESSPLSCSGLEGVGVNNVKLIAKSFEEKFTKNKCHFDSISTHMSLYPENDTSVNDSEHVSIQAKHSSNITSETVKDESKHDEKPKSLIDVPNLTISDVCKYLEELGLAMYVRNFQKERVDGSLLLDLDQTILREEFGMTGIEALRLCKFAKEGHIPV